MLYRRLHRSGG